ncbi:leucine-rich repeat-containing protein 24 [Adelges cooleyi]|uniref:leucine-rich repeat-containing protein 24 n=1 Tax=Adelges cooleyi TaxID=133065 RepID=UPI0021806C8F|nr:leucine-rich repeat-containing protein 24 [Adelges cooleyi]XP_050441801.1 leucine-rich repeat-containing protein 24 [Adelges cooleyi]
MRSDTPLLLLAVVAATLVAATACPLTCTCKWKGGKQTVECVNKSLSTIPDGIDPGTQVLDMSGNPVKSLPQGRFITAGLANLQKIFMARCRIAYVDDGAFQGLSNMVELDLSDNGIADIPSKSFDDYPLLMKLVFSGNAITVVRTAAFRRLSYLTVLDLSRCRLETIEPGAFDGLASLEWLRLNDNRIVRMVSGSGGSVLPLSLHGIEIHHNPWDCDCRLLDVHRWLNNNSAPHTVEPSCHSPERLRGMAIKKLARDELACTPTAKTTSAAFQETETGKNLTLSCQLSPAGVTAAISWWFEGRPLGNETALTSTADETEDLLIPEVTVRHNGSYSCVAENRAGRTTCNFTVRVIQGPSETVAGSYSPSTAVPMLTVGILAGGALCFLIIAVASIVGCQIMCSGRRTRTGGKSNPSPGASATQNGQASKSTSDVRQSDSVNLTVSSTVEGKMSSVEDVSAYEYEANSPASAAYEVHEVLQVSGYDMYQPVAATQGNTTLEANPDLISDASTVVKDNGDYHNDTAREVYKLVVPPPSAVSRADYWSPATVYPMTSGGGGYDLQQLSPSKLMAGEPYPADYGLPKLTLVADATAYPPDYGLPRMSAYPPPPALYRTLPHRRNAAKPQGRTCQEAEFVLVQQHHHRNHRHHHHHHVRYEPQNVRYNQQGYPYVAAGPDAFYVAPTAGAYYESHPPSLSNASAQTLDEDMEPQSQPPPTATQPPPPPTSSQSNYRQPEQHKAVASVQNQPANSESPDEGYVGEGPDS